MEAAKKTCSMVAREVLVRPPAPPPSSLSALFSVDGSALMAAAERCAVCRKPMCISFALPP